MYVVIYRSLTNMFTRLLILLTFTLIGILATLVLATGEEFAEKLLPILFVVTVIVYLFLSWYLGYFVSTQKPSLELTIVAVAGLIIAFMSGYYMGR